MLRRLCVLLVCAWALAFSAPPAQTLSEINAELQKHVSEVWLDGSPEAVELLERAWALLADTAGGWLDHHQNATPVEFGTALTQVWPDGVDGVALREDAWLVAVRGVAGNAFLLQRRDGRFRRVWHTGEEREGARGRMAGWLDAWHARNAREKPVSGRRGGPMFPTVGKLPPDARGRLRFWVEGSYAQVLGCTGLNQILLWSWDERMATPLLGHEYLVVCEQRVGTRFEGDVLKAQQKKNYRSWFACGMCEGRQTDWLVRVTPTGLVELGEKPAVPELDAIDDLLWLTLRGKPVPSTLASLEARRVAGEMKDTADSLNYGMMMWSATDLGNGRKLFCIAADNAGSALFRVQKRAAGFYVESIAKTRQSCESPPVLRREVQD